MKPDLSVNLCGKKLQNPLILASGFLGKEAELLKRVSKSGAGAVVSKSCGKSKKIGNENPTVLAWEHGVINAVGLTNPGYLEETEKLKKLKKLLRDSKTFIIASIFGPTIKDIAKIATHVSSAKPDFIEINVSCPHADPTVKGTFYSNPKALFRLTQTIKKNTNIPIIVKLSPNVTDIKIIAKAAEDGGADAISAINTVMAMLIDVESGKPLLTNKIGGISGPAVKPIALRCIYQIAQTVKIPIIGMGGVTYGKDVVEMIMVGATAIGVGSAIYYRGINVFKKITKEIEEFMINHGYKSLKEFRGIAHED